MKKLTIYDIAKLSGVSKSTVSRFLNGGYVSQKNQQLLEKVIAEHDFKPSQSAIALRTKASKTLGVIIPRIDSFTTSRVVKGIMESAKRDNYLVEIIDTDLQFEREWAAYDMLVERNVCGIIALATDMNQDYEQHLRKLPVSVVVIGQQTEQIPCVYHDVTSAIQAFCQEVFANSGIERASLLTPGRSDRMLQRSIAEFQAACQEKGIQLTLFETDFSWQSAYRVAEQAYHNSPFLLCMTDNLAYGVYKFAQERQLAIGEQIHISGIGGYDTSQLLTPELSTIAFFYKQAGQMAADYILRDVDHSLEPLGYELVLTPSFAP